MAGDNQRKQRKHTNSGTYLIGEEWAILVISPPSRFDGPLNKMSSYPLNGEKAHE
jgi:hypothetical protein